MKVPIRLLAVPRWLQSAAVVAVLMVLGTNVVAHRATASSQLVDQAFSLRPGMAHIMQAGLVREVNLPQSTCGFTMTIQRVYADANRVVVGYTITGPTNRSFINAFYGGPPK